MKASSKILVLCIFIQIAVTSSLAQNKQQLKVGDKVPKLVSRVYGLTPGATQGYTLPNKKVILDFWATWCGPCVRSFPFIDSLSKEYSNNLEILPVTREGLGTIKPFIDRANKLKKINLKSVVGDTLLHGLFPFQTYPHYVWIDENHIVKGITYSESITRSKLDSFVKDLNPFLEVKDDFVEPLNLDYINPLFSQDKFHLPDSLIVQYSLLSKYIPGAKAAMGGNKLNKLLITNVVPELLFRQAYAKDLGSNIYGFASYSQIEIKSKDSLKLTYSKSMKDAEIKQWHQMNAYTYDIMVSMADTARMLDIMKKDLEVYFKVKASIEVRKRKVLVVSSDHVNEKYKSVSTRKILNSNAFMLEYEGVSMRRFLADLYKHYQSSYIGIENKTKYDGNINLNVAVQLNDLNQLAEALRPWGLLIHEEYRDVKVLVLKD